MSSTVSEGCHETSRSKTKAAFVPVALEWFVAAVGLVGFAALIALQATGLTGAPIHSDGYSYYVYLPAWFLYRDPSLAAVARDCCGGNFPDFTAIIRWPSTGAWVNAHPIGVAVMQAPAFLAAHALTRWSNLPPDGFSLYYQEGAALSGLAWLLVGLAVLRRYLARLFTPGVTLATLTAITFGTNLFHYAVFDGTFSHVYSFALLAALLLLIDAWWTRPSTVTSILLGAVGGLLVLVRHPNALFLALLPLYGISSTAGAPERLAALRARARSLVLIVVTAGLAIAPQLWLYHRATGHWLVSSYGALGFTWSSPHVYGVLFGVSKGLFFWSPILLFAVGGLMVARGAAARWTAGAVAVLAADTYVIASWWDWQFGGSFGHRGFTDALPLFAVFLAAFYGWAASKPKLAAAVASVSAAAVALSVAQMIQYWLGVLPIANTTWTQYRELFLRFR